MIDVFSALVGALITLLLAWWATHEGTRKVVGELYDKLVDYRREHPEVLTLARKWEPHCLTRIYNQCTEEDRQWALYYSYVELLLGYCTFVLVSKRRTLLGTAYTRHHRGLVKLLLTEHYPIVRDLTGSGGFVSPLVSAFISEQAKAGWDWHKQHNELDRIPVERRTD